MGHFTTKWLIASQNNRACELSVANPSWLIKHPTETLKEDNNKTGILPFKHIREYHNLNWKGHPHNGDVKLELMRGFTKP